MRFFIHLGTVGLALALVACSSSEKASIDGETETTSPKEATTETAAELSPTNTPTPKPTATPTPAPKEVVKLDEGFVARQNSYNNEYTHHWYVILENPSERAAERVRVRALFYDADGVLLGTDDMYAHLWAKQRTAVTGLGAWLASPAERMEVRIDGTPRWVDVQTEEFPTVSDVEIVRERFSGALRGRITSPWNKDVTDLRLVCILRDSEGTLLEVETSFLELLPAGATAVGDCSLWDDEVVNAAATGEMYVNWTSITSVLE